MAQKAGSMENKIVSLIMTSDRSSSLAAYNISLSSFFSSCDDGRIYCVRYEDEDM